MTHQNIYGTRITGKEFSIVKDAVYEATDAAIEAIEKAYAHKVSDASVSESKIYEAAYASKAAVKVSIYEIASRAISSMAVVASEEKAIIAASAIATIRQIQWS